MGGLDVFPAEVATQMPAERGRACRTVRRRENSRVPAVGEDKKTARAGNVPVTHSTAEAHKRL